MTPVQIYAIYLSNGSLDSAHDEDISAGIVTYETELDDIDKHPANYTVQTQRTISNLLVLLKQIIHDRITRASISWENTLNPVFTFHGSMEIFYGKARDMGYPYFAWGGRVYSVVDRSFTGVFSDDLK